MAAPTISTIDDQVIDEDTSTGALSFVVGDPDTPLIDLIVTASTSNPSLIPLANVVLGGINPNRTVTVTPLEDQNGVADITLTVDDGFSETDSVFEVKVEPVNDPPTISAIDDQFTTGGIRTGAIPFEVGDPEGDPGSLTLSADSSNPSLVPLNGITFGGFGVLRNIRLTPASNSESSLLQMEEEMAPIMARIIAAGDHLEELQREKINLELERQAVVAKIARLSDWEPEILPDLPLWCVDYNPNLEGVVGAIEIGDEIRAIKPGGAEGDQAVWTEADGIHQPSIGCHWSSVILAIAHTPASQKWMPAYRFGQILSIDSDKTKCRVELENAFIESYPERVSWDINAETRLADVPFDYMGVGGAPFEIGDQVAIAFEDFDWAKPSVIGFQTEPKESKDTTPRPGFLVVLMGCWGTYQYASPPYNKTEGWEEDEESWAYATDAVDYSVKGLLIGSEYVDEEGGIFERPPHQQFFPPGQHAPRSVTYQYKTLPPDVDFVFDEICKIIDSYTDIGTIYYRGDSIDAWARYTWSTQKQRDFANELLWERLIVKYPYLQFYYYASVLGWPGRWLRNMAGLAYNYQIGTLIYKLDGPMWPLYAEFE